MRNLLILLLSILIIPASQVLADQYTIDPDHSEIGFSIKHMVITNIKGAFTEYTAGFVVDNNKLVSVNADIVAASIDTRNQKRDDHLRSAEFFEITKFPHITFTSTSIVPVTGDNYKVKGLLKIRDVFEEIELDGELTKPVKDPWGNQRRGLILRGEIDRLKFGVTYNKILETGELLINNVVDIHLEGEGILKK